MHARTHAHTHTHTLRRRNPPVHLIPLLPFVSSRCPAESQVQSRRRELASMESLGFVDQPAPQPALQAQKAQKPLPASGSLTLDCQSGPGGGGGGPSGADKQCDHLITRPPVPQVPAAPTRLGRLLFSKEWGVGELPVRKGYAHLRAHTAPDSLPRVLWP